MTEDAEMALEIADVLAGSGDYQEVALGIDLARRCQEAGLDTSEVSRSLHARMAKGL